jgi:RNA polymerase sigma factor (sigma-70 family)
MDGERGRDDDLFRALYPGLRRFAAAVGPLEVDPDDLVQDALVRVLRRGPLATLDDPQAYLRRTIVNLAADRRRGFGRLRRALTRVDRSEGAASEYPSDLADLLALPPEVRAVLWLVDVEGRSFEDAAAVIGCSVTAARTRASRGRRQLRLTIAAEGSEERA